MERRVVVTGMGAVSPLGLDVPTLWQGVQESRSGVGLVTLCDTEKLDSKIAGEVKGFDAQNYMDRKEVRRNDRFIHFALAATHEALRSAELISLESSMIESLGLPTPKEDPHLHYCEEISVDIWPIKSLGEKGNG